MSDRFPGGVISKTPPVVSGEATGSNLYAWGSNGDGRLGLAGNGSGQASGVWTLSEVLGYQKAGQWPKFFDATANRSSPVSVGTLADWSQVSAGSVAGSNPCGAIKADGTLWMWGINAQGQLGDGTQISRSSPTQVGALTNWAQVSAGGNQPVTNPPDRGHTAAVKTDGTLWAWGGNGFGQLGDNSTSRRLSPVQIGSLTDWLQVSVGISHTAAVKTSGTLWTWGYNADGRLGQNISPATRRSSPVQVGALTNWAQVSAGEGHTASVKTDGTLWAWGFNFNGQIGDGTTVSKSSPVQIGTLTNWAQVSAGGSHTASIKTDGTLWAWGSNGNGRLGDGTVANKSSPVQIGALTNWAQVSAGGSHTASVKTDGTLWTWGRNDFGALGDDTTVARSSPVQIGSGTNWAQVSAGGIFTAAITTG